MPLAVLRILAVLVTSSSAVACGGGSDDRGGSLTVFAASSLTRVTASLADAFVASSPESTRSRSTPAAATRWPG